MNNFKNGTLHEPNFISKKKKLEVHVGSVLGTKRQFLTRFMLISIIARDILIRSRDNSITSEDN